MRQKREILAGLILFNSTYIGRPGLPNSESGLQRVRLWAIAKIIIIRSYIIMKKRNNEINIGFLDNSLAYRGPPQN